jgi:signal transduction histidine kinase/ActR/RegA family two-component response regulator
MTDQKSIEALYEDLKIYRAELESQNIELRQSQELLVKSRKEYYDLFNCAPVGYFILNSTAMIQQVNRTAADMFGIDGADYIQRPFSKLLTPSSQHIFLSRYRAFFKSPERKILELTLHSDKIERNCFLQGVRTESFGNREHSMILISVMDASYLKEAEENMFRARDLAESSNRAKSNFMAKMSHEIRTPLNAIIGLSTFAADSNDMQEIKKYLVTMKSSANHLLTVINDMLDFSKIEAGKLTLEKANFDPVECLTGIESAMSSLATAKGITLRFTGLELLPPLVKADKGRINQIFFNLLSNAIKFTNKGGVDVDLAAQETESGYDLKFEVKDTGIGIPVETISTIFEEFSHASTETNRIFGGTGLGLSITKQLIELMRGSIHAQSTMGQGSIFSGHFFVEKPGQVPSFEVAASSKKTSPMSILIAEDNEINTMVIQIALEKLGHTVAVAVNGVEALELLRKHSFDLVVMDIEMPEMDGIEATERMRRGEAGQKARTIPVIAFTAHLLSEIRERCKIAGMNDFLSKPLDMRALESALAGVQAKAID